MVSPDGTCRCRSGWAGTSCDSRVLPQSSGQTQFSFPSNYPHDVYWIVTGLPSGIDFVQNAHAFNFNPLNRVSVTRVVSDNVPAGNYQYQTKFDVDNIFCPAILVRFEADDSLSRIDVYNEYVTTSTFPYAGSGFVLVTGLGWSNTLTFYVTNTGGPTSLYANFQYCADLNWNVRSPTVSTYVHAHHLIPNSVWHQPSSSERSRWIGVNDGWKYWSKYWIIPVSSIVQF